MSTPLPSRLGRYQVIDALGKGAMGVVYLAKDPLIGRLVALKTFRGDIGDQEFQEARERFIREAQSAGILSHPNIVTIHDVVEHSDEGMTFIAMEYVRGTDLKEQLRRDEPFDLPTIADIIWQVAEALEYAHSKGVVHRDIKPANILITGDGRAKLTDFGIARINTSNLTHSGQLLGTPNYMAPEQIQGLEVDHRADIFSLGVVLYELLTRRKPFAGDNLTVVTHRIVNESFTPPEEFVGELPPGVRQVLEKALAKAPADRYQRVAELAVELKKTVEQARDALNDTQAVAQAAAAAAPAPSLPEPPPAPPAEPKVAAPVAPRIEAATPALDPAESETILASVSQGAVAPPPLPPPPQAPPPAAAPAAASAAPSGPSLGLPAGPALSEIDLPPIPERSTRPVEKRPPPPPTPKAEPAPRPAGARRPNWLLLGGLGSVALVVLLLGGWWLASSLAPPPPPPEVKQTSPEVLEAMIQRAESLIAAGDWEEARKLLTEAEALSPTSARIRELRVRAEQGASGQLAEAAKAEQARSLVATGEEQLAAGRSADAAESARQALALVPGDVAASDLLRRAEPPGKVAGRTPTATPGSPPGTSPVPASPSAPRTGPTATPSAPSTPAPAPVGDATLKIHFYSEKPSGVLTLYADKHQLLRESFKFAEKTGFLRSKAIPGSFDRVATVPVGPVTLRVLVLLEKTEVQTLQGNFPPGSTRELTINVDADGIVKVSLR
ncbi:MAG: protein kinase [Thermoanaerobaculia bacterium]